MSQRTEQEQDRALPAAVTDFERERLDWQRRLYAAEDLAARLLSEKNQLDVSLKQRIAELETEVVRLRQRIEDQRKLTAAQAATRESSAGNRAATHDDPFGHVIRQAHKGKHARVQRKLRQHLLFLVLIGLVLGLAATLVWQGLKSRAAATGIPGLTISDAGGERHT